MTRPVSQPAPRRVAIELAFFEGLTHHEVAERLQPPLGTVKTRIRLGMSTVRETLSALAPARAT
ncbi:sigma factor-like helix-turn-helix DNA-binding protein [Gemmatimonas sp.]|uniref:sigma factor-like helix-turn-helix DNA-binding protein n=1 Tax=Gemmatimonas sp. TaxID=1962908 RepID=UPI0037C03B8F